jgi:ficolin
MALTATAALSLLVLVLCRHDVAYAKPHGVQKRSSPTPAEVLGDMSSQSSTIVNSLYAPLTNCKELHDDGHEESGCYNVNPFGSVGKFTVFCDMNLLSDEGQDGGGWTVIARRVGNDTSFNRDWAHYKGGFGNYNGSFWLGLQKIKELTDYGSNGFELYIGMESFSNKVRYARYKSFMLGTEIAKYKLTLGDYDDTIPVEYDAGDALSDRHDGMEFSTPDRDNDNSGTTHCASEHEAGWWYNNCHESHLTGRYYTNGHFTANNPDGIVWKPPVDFHPSPWEPLLTSGSNEVLKSVVMAVRPRPSNT